MRPHIDIWWRVMFIYIVENKRKKIEAITCNEIKFLIPAKKYPKSVFISYKEQPKSANYSVLRRSYGRN